MSVKTEIARISEAKAAIRESIEKKGQTIAADAKIDTFSAAIDLLSNIDGAACGKFTWDGNYPVYCDCSALTTAPACILIFSPALIYSSSTSENAAVIAARGIGTSTTTWFVAVTQKNTVGTALAHDWILYDAASSSVLIKSASAGSLISGQDYYWVAV